MHVASLIFADEENFVHKTILWTSGDIPMILPPTSQLPSIRQMASYPINDLRKALSYLRHLYNPQVRGSRRHRRELISTAGNTSHLELDESDGLDELRSDGFERSYSMRWLTSLVSLTANWDSESCSDGTHSKEWEGLVQEAASLLAVCSGTAGAGVVIRDLVFKIGPEMEQTLEVQVKDLSLDNKDYGSVGAQTWGGACVLTETILDDPVAFGLSDVHELRILELGAGTGLVSLALGKLFESASSLIPPRTIIATDYYPSVLENLASNIQTNFPDSDAVQARFLDWSSFSNDAGEPFDIPFDLILGADIIYEAQHAIWIKSCLAKLLRKPTSSQDPLFHLMIPLRSTHSFESSTIDSVFAAPTADNNSSELHLVIISKESVLCDAAPGTGHDTIEYAYYRIGWR